VAQYKHANSWHDWLDLTLATVAMACLIGYNAATFAINDIKVVGLWNEIAILYGQLAAK